jgi:protoporphyrinogen oxidase
VGVTETFNEGSGSTLVIGGGPAGLAAAWELSKRGVKVTVLEKEPKDVGGLSRTLTYKGFRFDIGGHRFFSKNQEMSQWWRARLPNDFIRVKRLSRIYYRGRFFHYPLRAGDALIGLGLGTSMACVASYLWRRLLPIAPERSFEDWVINRFGDRLYQMFFKTYTEKVWGMPCSQISADWASQRIKGLSLWAAARNAFSGRRDSKETAKTLIDEFDYPRLGPGMLWEKVRDDIVRQGGRVYMGRSVLRFERSENRIVSVITKGLSGELEQWSGESFIVSMPLQHCALAMNPCLTAKAQAAAKQLSYRDFLLVILIVNRRDLFADNWIYIHAPEVKVGRIQNFNNWGEDMVPDRNVTSLEFEYFCSRGDPFWSLSDAEIAEVAKRELETLGLAKASDVLDTCVVRVEKAYPVYDANYQKNVEVIRQALEPITNLQIVGRNGMHKYNNQDHSMLTGILASRNLTGESYDVWRVNTDAEYLEEGQATDSAGRSVPRSIEQVDVTSS